MKLHDGINVEVNVGRQSCLEAETQDRDKLRKDLDTVTRHSVFGFGVKFWCKMLHQGGDLVLRTQGHA